MGTSRTDFTVSARIDPVFRTEIERLQKALDGAYDRRTMNKFIKIAELNAARTLVVPIRSAVPHRTGRMARAVKARVGRYRRPSAVVGPRQKGTSGAFYARFVLKTGAEGHRIPSESRLKAALKTGVGLRASVRHPGIRPNRAVTRAAEANLDKAHVAFGATIAKLINDREFRGKIAGLQAKYAGKTRP